MSYAVAKPKNNLANGMGAYGTKINGQSSTDIEAQIDGGAIKELKKSIESKLT